MDSQRTPQLRLQRHIETNSVLGIDIHVGLGADVNKLVSGEYPLELAVRKGHYAAAERLLHHKASVDASPLDTQVTALMIATQNGDVNIMKLLLRHGANAARRSANDTPLCMYAARARKNPEAVWKLLMDPTNGMPQDEVPSNPVYGNSILDQAVNTAIHPIGGAYCDPMTPATVIRLGAPWETYKNQFGETCLHSLLHAVIQKSVTNPAHDNDRACIGVVIKNMLEAGVSPFQMNEGVSAYVYAKLCWVTARIFSEFCTARYEAKLVEGKLAADRLVDARGKATDLTMYGCCTDRLGLLLSPARWENTLELLRVKQQLAACLPESYRKQYDAELDVTADMREAATGSAFKRFTGIRKARGMG